jgi:hypothetical protein
MRIKKGRLTSQAIRISTSNSATIGGKSPHRVKNRAAVLPAGLGCAATHPITALSKKKDPAQSTAPMPRSQ